MTIEKSSYTVYFYFKLIKIKFINNYYLSTPGYFDIYNNRGLLFDFIVHQRANAFSKNELKS